MYNNWKNMSFPSKNWMTFLHVAVEVYANNYMASFYSYAVKKKKKKKKNIKKSIVPHNVYCWRSRCHWVPIMYSQT